MATYIDDNTPLYPGDLVTIVFEIISDDQAAVNKAIRQVKQDVARDKRWHYQSGVVETRTDPDTGETYQALVIRVQVADPAKWMGHEPPPTVEEANAGVIVVAVAKVAWAAVFIVAALVGYSYRDTVRDAIRFRAWNFDRHPGYQTIRELQWPLVLVAIVVLVLLFRGK